MDLKTQIETLLAAFWDKRAQDIIDDPLSTDELGAPLDSISAVDAFVGIDSWSSASCPSSRSSATADMTQRSNSLLTLPTGFSGI